MLIQEREKNVELAIKDIEKELASLNVKKSISIFDLDSNDFDNCGKCGKACCDYRT